MKIKNIIIIICIVFLLGTVAAAKVYYSVNAGCEGNLVGVGGGSVFDKDGITKLKVGDIVQYIYSGRNGIIDPPGSNGGASGDDVLLLTSQVGTDNVWRSFGQREGFFFNGVTGKIEENSGFMKVYIRAWNNSKIIPRIYYGDSQLIVPDTSSVIVPPPKDVGVKSFSTNKIFK